MTSDILGSMSTTGDLCGYVNGMPTLDSALSVTFNKRALDKGQVTQSPPAQSEEHHGQL